MGYLNLKCLKDKLLNPGKIQIEQSEIEKFHRECDHEKELIVQEFAK